MLREKLTTIFDAARGRADGLRRIRFWRQRVTKSGLRCFDGFLSLLDTWLDLIANYLIDHQTSAFDMLEVYIWPDRDDIRLICMDEVSTQLLSDTREAIPAQASQPKRQTRQWLCCCA